MAPRTKSERVLAILKILLDGEPCTISSLARHFGTSPRSIFRDIATLEKAGFATVRENASQGIVLKSFGARTPEFTSQEILLLDILLENAARENTVPMAEAAQSAKQKLIDRLPATAKSYAVARRKYISIKSEPLTKLDGCERNLNIIFDCLLASITIDCTYEASHSSKSSGKADTFRFDPYELIFASHAWYIVGYRRDREAFRTLKINRFATVANSGRHFRRNADFSLAKHLKNAWRIIPGKPALQVELLFNRDFADNIEETRWHPTQNTERLDDGRLRFTCDVDGMDEIKWWILSMGPNCQVVAPAVLRNEVLRLAQWVVDSASQ